MNRKTTAFVFSAFLISIILSADGYHVRRWIPLKEQVKKTPLILTGTIIKNIHKWAERRAYGETRRYIARYRFRIRIREILKNSSKNRNITAGKAITVHRFGGTVPGKWVLIAEKYRESLHPFTVKPGTRCIVYCHPEYGGKYRFTGLDRISRKRQVVKHLNPAE